MAFFKKRKGPAPQAVVDLPAPATVPPWAVRSEFIKQATCHRCGAQKTLPSKTAYLYCDHCAALIDYDFRLANADPSRGTTNMVYQRLSSPLRGELDLARSRSDRDHYRKLQLNLFTQWVQLCPQAVSPRAKSDEDFRNRMIQYLAETTVTKDLDPRQAPLDAQLAVLNASLQRVSTPSGPQLVGEGFWPMAALFKQQMDPADGERLIADFGVHGDYVRIKPQETLTHGCGGCGAELHTVVGAKVVVCEDCGRKIDIDQGEAPCANCGAPLSFPLDTSHIQCPYCHAETERV